MADEFDSVRRTLTARRKLLRLTQQQVADRLGCSNTYVAHLEKGHYTPQHGTWVRWAKALGFEVVVTLRDDGTNGGGPVPRGTGRKNVRPKR